MIIVTKLYKIIYLGCCFPGGADTMPNLPLYGNISFKTLH